MLTSGSTHIGLRESKGRGAASVGRPARCPPRCLLPERQDLCHIVAAWQGGRVDPEQDTACAMPSLGFVRIDQAGQAQRHEDAWNIFKQPRDDPS